MPRFCIALSLTVALSAVPARAADLLQIYRDALANDATYGSARATRDAGLENLPQGLAQILPTVNATAFTQYNDIAIGFRAVTPEQYQYRLGNSNGYTVTLTQPLFNWQNIQVYKEAGFKAVQAEATFGQATQDLIVRVAQAYFDVLASQDGLAFIQAQKIAMSAHRCELPVLSKLFAVHRGSYRTPWRSARLIPRATTAGEMSPLARRRLR